MKRLLSRLIPGWSMVLFLGLAGFTYLIIQGEVGLQATLQFLSGDYRMEFEQAPFDPLEREMARQENLIHELAARAQRIHAVQELAPLVVASDAPLMVEALDVFDVSAEVLEAAGELLLAERVTSEPVKVGVFGMDPTEALPEGIGPLKSRGRDFIAGEIDGAAYCLNVRLVSSTADWSYQWEPNVLVADLGSCRMISRYGLPGQFVGQWYDRQGSDRVARVNVPARIYGSYLPRLDGRACQAGSDAHCSQFWSLDPANGRASSGDQDLALIVDEQGSAPRRWGPVIDMAGLTMLEREFGGERFLEFWTSDLAVEDAFLKAFGTPANEWLRERLWEHYPTRQAGPLPGAGILIMTALIALMGVLLGMRATVQRATA